MRISILLLLLLFLNAHQASTQANTPGKLPSQKQYGPTRNDVQAQMKQAQAETRQMIIEKEKEIADAKKTGENPESIRELEQELAMLKKVFSGFEKMSTTISRPHIEQPVKTVIPKYVSPIISIPLKQPVVAPTAAQAKDKLLWYTGKKIDGNTLITPNGMVVQYRRSANIVVIVPDQKKDTPINNIVANLSLTGQRKMVFATGMKNIMNSFMMYPQIEEAYEEFDLLTERYNKIARNTLDLDVSNGVSLHSFHADPYMNHSGPDAGDIDDAIAGLQEMYKHLLDLLNQSPPTDFPPPPERPNDLCLCDPNIRKKYERALAAWSETFWGYEDQLLQSFKQIQKHLTDNAGVDLSGMPTLAGDLVRAIKIAFERRDKKIRILMAMYTTDVTREEALVMAVLANEREKQKYGVADFSSTSIAELKSLLSAGHFNMYIDKKIMEKDYNVIFDYSLYLSHEFHKQLLGAPGDSWNSRYFKWMELIADFNRFKFSIEMDFEFQERNETDVILIADGSMKVDPVEVRLGRMGCKWQLFLLDVDYAYGKEKEDKFRLPVKVIRGLKKINNGRKWETYNYSGPPTAQMVFPSVRLSFCNGSSDDSLLLDVLRFSDQELSGHYGICKPDFGKMYCLDILQFGNQMLIGIVKTKDNTDDLLDLAFDMMAVPGSARVEKPTGSALLDQLQIEYSVNLKQHEMQKRLGSMSKVDPSVVLFDAVNKSPVLIEKVADARNTQVGGLVMTRADVKLKVVHAPKQQFSASQIPY